MIIYCILLLASVHCVYGSFENTFSDDFLDVPVCNITINKTSSEIKVSGSIVSNMECWWEIEPANETDDVFILFRVLHLEDDDNVTIHDINSIKLLFGPFHGQNDAIVVLTGVTSVTVRLNTSSKSTLQRKFEAMYGSVGGCVIKVPDDIYAMTAPIYSNETGANTECRYIYDRDTKHPDTFTFTFESFDLSQGSTITVTGTEQPNGPYDKTKHPMDLFSKAQTTFDIKMDPKSPNDNFRLLKHNVNADCSGFEEISTLPALLRSPVPQKLLNTTITIECRWLIKSKDSTILGIDLGTLQFNSVFDELVINDGSSILSPPLVQITQSSIHEYLDKVIRTSGPYMWIAFKPVNFISNFSGNVSIHGQGGYYKSNGTLNMRSTTGNDTAFLLEVNSDENVLLNFKTFNFASPAALHVYSSFYRSTENLIAVLHGNVWFPVLSPTSKMMIIATSFNTGSFEATFKGIKSGCTYMSPVSGGTYVLSGNCNRSCDWIVPPNNNNEDQLLVDIQYISLNEDDEVSVFRLDANKTSVAKITSNVTRVPKFSVNANIGAMLHVIRGNCSKKPDNVVLIARSSYLPGCSKNFSVTSPQEIQLTSPSYPNTYPLHSICKWNIVRPLENSLLFITFEKLQLAANHCIKVSQILKGKTVSGTFYGSQIPDDFLFTGNAELQFDSSSCNSSKVTQSLATDIGFSLNITSLDCGGVFNGKNGQLNTVINKTICIWMVDVPKVEKDGSVNIITFNVSYKDETGNYDFSVYDGASVRSDKITNITKKEVWSRTNTVVFIYKRLNASSPSTQIAIDYNVKNCNKTMQCENQICLHPDWRCNGINDCGDFSDEKNCASVPIPPDVKTSGGVSSVTFGITIICFFVLGVLLAFVVPRLIEKYRNNQYRHFSDMTVGD